MTSSTPARYRCRCLLGVVRRLLPALACCAACAHAAGDAENGKRLIRHYACTACHDVPGVRGPMGTVGPPLDHMGRRAYIAGVIPNTEAEMVRWLQNPPAVDARTAMPNMGISAAEARDIAAYLATLD